MGIIFIFSMDNGVESSEKSSDIIVWLTETVLQRDLTEQEMNTYIEKYSYPIRKTAHFTIYFILGLLFIILLEEYHEIQRKEIIYTIIFVLMYAVSDEIHQLFINERSGQITDVLLDTSGGIASSISYFYLQKIRKKNKRQK